MRLPSLQAPPECRVLAVSLISSCWQQKAKNLCGQENTKTNARNSATHAQKLSGSLRCWTVSGNCWVNRKRPTWSFCTVRIIGCRQKSHPWTISPNAHDDAKPGIINGIDARHWSLVGRAPRQSDSTWSTVIYRRQAVWCTAAIDDGQKLPKIFDKVRES